jgi:hypothetical protein
MRRGATIVVSGMVAGVPGQGGAAWAVLQYVLGFRRLGHEVYLVEPVATGELQGTGLALGETEQAAYMRGVAAAFDLGGRYALLRAGSTETVGLTYAELRGVGERADLLLNLSGLLRDEALTGRIPVRVYLDLDPGFTQLWSAVEGIDMRFGGHTHFVTVGQLIGEEGCRVPTCGLEWLKTLPPVVLERWPVVDREPAYRALTTVAHWRGYGSIGHEGVWYGQKAHSLRRFFELPRRVPDRFLLALSIHADERNDRAALRENGWELMDPGVTADTPWNYQRFVQDSWAEFGIAKSGYVESGCGWFSDRSVCYLASGRPVLTQETGFSRYLPGGGGVWVFRDVGEILSGLEEIRGDYGRQRLRAREVAEGLFDSDAVLTRLLERVGM